MCGICGAWGRLESGVLDRMLAALAHRGPDSEGRFVSPEVSLGSRRLAVIDPEGGGQPMASRDGRIQVVLGGLIYNHRELRQELEARGHRFRTRSDTEVLIHLWQELGPEMLPRLDGMFALAVWDARARRLLLARDRLGERSLYYMPDGDRLLFANELKALLASGLAERRLSPAALDHFLTFRSIPAPLTALAGIRALRPAEALLLDSGGMRLHRYWHPTSSYRPPTNGRQSDWAAELKERLTDSIRRRLRADVPLGAFLSGGLDSSLMVALAQHQRSRPLPTFTMGFDEPERGWPLDERAKARRVAEHLGTDHHEIGVTGGDARAALPDFILAMDQPTGDGVQHYLLYREAARHVRVVLSGTGGDELFAGYRWFRTIRLMSRLDPWLTPLGRRGRSLLGRMGSGSVRARALLEAHGSFAGKYAFTSTLFKEGEKERLLDRDLLQELRRSGEPRPLQQIQAIADQGPRQDPVAATSHMLLHTDLPTLLLRDADALGMSHALCIRNPLLDHRVVELALGAPIHHKIRGRQSKVLLRRVAGSVLPPPLLEPPKQGFFAPLGRWMRRELAPVVADALSPESTRRRGLFQPDEVEAVYRRFQEGREPYFKAWALTALELWQRRFLDGEGERESGMAVHKRPIVAKNSHI